MARPSPVSSRTSWASLRWKGLGPRGGLIAAVGHLLLHGGDAPHGEAAAAHGRADLGVGVLEQVFGDESGGDLVESPGGGHAVSVLEAFEAAIGDAEVELGDAAAVVGHLADDFGPATGVSVVLPRSWVLVYQVCQGGKIFTTEDTEGAEVKSCGERESALSDWGTSYPFCRLGPSKWECIRRWQPSNRPIPRTESAGPLPVGRFGRADSAGSSMLACCGSDDARARL